MNAPTSPSGKSSQTQHAERLQYEPMRTFIIDQPIRTVDLKRFGF